MTLPLRFPFTPMESLSVRTIPVGPEWQYEPKWDGFRCLAFRDRTSVELQSKAGKRLTRYFPELVDALRGLEDERFVLDGEIVVPADGGFSFDALLQRIHPAASRIQRLAAETPALLIAFDLLVNARCDLLTQLALQERREELERFLRENARQRNAASPFALNATAFGRQRLAETHRKRARRCHRQATRPAVSFR